MENKRIAFIYDKLHPLHKKFFKSINCDFFPLFKDLPKNYDIYVFEGTYIKPILLKKIGKVPKNAKIITLFSDPRLFYLYTKRMFNLRKEKMIKYPIWRAIIAKKFLKELDGAICTSQLTAELFKKFNKKSPVIVTPGFVFKENANKISKIKPNLENHNILFIGHGPDYNVKGIDIMIESFREVKKDFPDSKLYILGKWEIKKKWKSKDVLFEGEKDIMPYLKKCSLSIHLGRGESFGINVIETMLAGIPTMVSDYTGAKDIVEKAGKDLVVSLDKGRISKRIENYFNSDLKEKEKTSKECRNIAGKYNEKDMLNNFKKKFDKLIKEIYAE